MFYRKDISDVIDVGAITDDDDVRPRWEELTPEPGPSAPSSQTIDPSSSHLIGVFSPSSQSAAPSLRRPPSFGSPSGARSAFNGTTTPLAFATSSLSSSNPHSVSKTPSSSSEPHSAFKTSSSSSNPHSAFKTPSSSSHPHSAFRTPSSNKGQGQNSFTAVFASGSSSVYPGISHSTSAVPPIFNVGGGGSSEYTFLSQGPSTTRSSPSEALGTITATQFNPSTHADNAIEAGNSDSVTNRNGDRLAFSKQGHNQGHVVAKFPAQIEGNALAEKHQYGFNSSTGSRRFGSNCSVEFEDDVEMTRACTSNMSLQSAAETIHQSSVNNSVPSRPTLSTASSSTTDCETTSHKSDDDTASSASTGSSGVRAAIRKGIMSPPTPAPSPTPGRNGWWGPQTQPPTQPHTRASVKGKGRESAEDDAASEADGLDDTHVQQGATSRSRERTEILAGQFDPAAFLLAFPSLPAVTRLKLLDSLLPFLSTPELLMLSQHIGPRLKRDFMKDLPTELALHILSFVDHPKTLARAACVSRHWRKLLEDDRPWKHLCDSHRFGKGRTLPTPSALPQPLNGPEFALTAGPGSVIPSSTNGIMPALGVTNPTMYHTTVVSRDGGVYEPGQNRNAAVSFSRRNRVAQQAPAEEGLHIIADIPTFQQIPEDEMAVEINGQLPPLPSVIPPGAAALDLSNISSAFRPAFPKSSSAPIPSTSSTYDVPSSKANEPGFSYKRHFKKAYMTETNWIHGGRLLSSHTSNDDGVVTSLAVDSDYIVIGMANSKIHVFRASDGRFVRSLDGHTLGVWCLALISVDANAQVEELNEDLSEDDASGLPFSASAATQSDGLLKRPRSKSSRYSALSKGRKRTRDGQLRSFSSTDNRSRPSEPSGRRHFSHQTGSSTSSSEWLFDPITTNTARQMPQSDVCGAARGWGQSFPIVVSGGCDRDVRVWNLETGECLFTMPGHTSTVRCIKVIEGKPIAVTGSRDGTIKIWNVEEGRMIYSLVGHGNSVRCIEVAGHHIASGSYDGTCRIWNAETGACLQILEGHYHQIYAVAFNGERVATGSLDSTVRVWSAATGETLALLQGHTSLVGQLQFSGDMLVSGGSDGRVIIFDMVTYTCLQRICAHDNSVTCLQFDDRFIVSGGNDGRVKLWDLKTGNFIRELSKPCESVWRLAFRDDKLEILCKRDDKTVLEVLSFIPEHE